MEAARGAGMERRRFLFLLAAGLTGAAAVHGGAELLAGAPGVLARAGGPTTGTAPRRSGPAAAPVGRAAVAARTAPAAAHRPVLAPTGVVARLPGAGSSIALTVDDGVSTEVVAGYVAFARRTGVRLTFFPNGCYRSWTENAAALRPLVESGQVAIGNHTWSHPDLTTLPDARVAEEIRRNRDFLRRTLGVRDTPFLRPPYGAHDARTDRIAADLGHPTIALWDGTLGDNKVLSAAEILAQARRWFAARRIVIGHANHPAVTTVFDQLHQVLAERRLTTVTLADVWATRGQLLRGAGAAGSTAVG